MIDLVFSLSFPQVEDTNCPNKLSRVSCPNLKVRKGPPTSPDISKHTGDNSFIVKYYE